MSTSFKPNPIRTAVAVALASGLVVSATSFAGIPDPAPVLPIVIALEDVPGVGTPAVGAAITAPVTWQIGIQRNRDQNFSVVFTLDPGVVIDLLAPAPILTISPGVGAAPVLSLGPNTCNLGNGGPGFNFVRFDCTLPAAGDVVFAGNHLDMTGLVVSQTGVDDLCSAGKTLGIAAQVIDFTSGVPIDNTGAGVPFPLGLLTTAPASGLLAVAEPTPGLSDAGPTLTDVFGNGGLVPPLAAFIPSPDTVPGAPPDNDLVGVARANFQVVDNNFGGLNAQSLDGLTIPYVLQAADVIDLYIDDPAMDFAGSVLDVGLDPFLCVVADPVAGGDCGAPVRKFTRTGPGVAANMAIPGSVPWIGTVQSARYGADGVNSMGVSRTLGIRGQVTGNKGCVVGYPGNANWWPWGSNAFVLEANNVSRPATAGGLPLQKHVYTLSNNCAYPVQYFVVGGTGIAGQNANLCPSNGRPCAGTIPAAVGGQPGIEVKGIETIALTSPTVDFTARFLVAAPPNCVKGSYEESDPAAGTKQITIMERDFGSFLSN
jgi:hypothetical protein